MSESIAKYGRSVTEIREGVFTLAKESIIEPGKSKVDKLGRK